MNATSTEYQITVSGQVIFVGVATVLPAERDIIRVGSDVFRVEHREWTMKVVGAPSDTSLPRLLRHTPSVELQCSRVTEHSSTWLGPARPPVPATR